MPVAQDPCQFLHLSIVRPNKTDLAGIDVRLLPFSDADVSSHVSLPTNSSHQLTKHQIVCSRAGFYLDETLGYSDFGSGTTNFDLSMWRKGFNAPGPQNMYFI